MFSAPLDNRFIDFLSNTSRNPLRLGRGQGPFLSLRFLFSLRLARLAAPWKSRSGMFWFSTYSLMTSSGASPQETTQ